MNAESVPAGSIIKRDLDGVPGVVYAHVGIYVGDGRVIHFDGEAFGDRDGRVREVSLPQFTKGRPHKVSAEPRSEQHGAAVVGEARRILGNPSTWNDTYNFAFRNCEDFAQHCFEVEYFSGTGRKKESSPWSQRLRTIAAGVSTAVVLVVTVIAGAPPPQASCPASRSP